MSDYDSKSTDNKKEKDLTKPRGRLAQLVIALFYGRDAFKTTLGFAAVPLAALALAGVTVASTAFLIASAIVLIPALAVGGLIGYGLYKGHSKADAKLSHAIKKLLDDKISSYDYLQNQIVSTQRLLDDLVTQKKNYPGFQLDYTNAPLSEKQFQEYQKITDDAEKKKFIKERLLGFESLKSRLVRVESSLYKFNGGMIKVLSDDKSVAGRVENIRHLMDDIISHDGKRAPDFDSLPFSQAQYNDYKQLKNITDKEKFIKKELLEADTLYSAPERDLLQRTVTPLRRFMSFSGASWGVMTAVAVMAGLTLATPVGWAVVLLAGVGVGLGVGLGSAYLVNYVAESTHEKETKKAELEFKVKRNIAGKEKLEQLNDFALNNKLRMDNQEVSDSIFALRQVLGMKQEEEIKLTKATAVDKPIEVKREAKTKRRTGKRQAVFALYTAWWGLKKFWKYGKMPITLLAMAGVILPTVVTTTVALAALIPAIPIAAVIGYAIYKGQEKADAALSKSIDDLEDKLEAKKQAVEGQVQEIQQALDNLRVQASAGERLTQYFDNNELISSDEFNNYCQLPDGASRENFVRNLLKGRAALPGFQAPKSDALQDVVSPTWRFIDFTSFGIGVGATVATLALGAVGVALAPVTALVGAVALIAVGLAVGIGAAATAYSIRKSNHEKVVQKAELSHQVKQLESQEKRAGKLNSFLERIGLRKKNVELQQERSALSTKLDTNAVIKDLSQDGLKKIKLLASKQAKQKDDRAISAWKATRGPSGVTFGLKGKHPVLNSPEQENETEQEPGESAVSSPNKHSTNSH